MAAPRVDFSRADDAWRKKREAAEGTAGPDDAIVVGDLPTLGELATDPELLRPPVYVMPPLLELGAVTLLSGKPKAGKSTFAGQLVAAFTRGVHWSTGEALPEIGMSRRVLWCGVDEPMRYLVPRMLRFEADPDCVRIFRRADGKLSAALLRAHVARVAPTLVVVDTLSQVASDHRIKPNDADMVAPFLRSYVDVIHEAGAAGLFLYHTPKHSDGAAGSAQWEAVVDNPLTFRPPRRAGAKPGEPEPDDDAPETRSDGGRILHGTMRSEGELRLRLSYVGNRYVEGDLRPPLRERLLHALRVDDLSINELRNQLAVNKAELVSLVDSLETEGLLSFSTANRHSPKRKAMLTDRGRRIILEGRA